MKEGVRPVDIKVTLVQYIYVLHYSMLIIQEWLSKVENIDPTHPMVFKLKVCVALNILEL